MRLYERKKWIVVGPICLLFAVQIVLSIVWMFCNVHALQAFGDTGEYIALSKALKFDEVRTIFYPLFLRGALNLSELLHIQDYALVYAVQTLVSFAACLWFVLQMMAITGVAANQSRKVRLAVACLVSFCILTIPVVTQFNFAVLVDSFALSFTLCSAVCMMRLLFLNDVSLLNGALSMVFMLLQFQLRADRVYTVILFLLFSFALLFMSKTIQKTEKRKATTMIILAFIAAFGVNTAINKATQTPGLYNRMPLNVKITISCMVLWPNLAYCYDVLPTEFQETVSKEEAQAIDTDANSLTALYNKIMASYGKAETERIFIKSAVQIAKTIPDRLVVRHLCIFRDFLLSPLHVVTDINGMSYGAGVWNYTRMTANTPALTALYFKCSYYLFLLLIAWLPFVCGCKKLGLWVQKSLPVLFYFACISATFSFLGSAPANYRYVIIGHVWWYMLLLATAAYEMADAPKRFTNGTKQM